MKEKSRFTLARKMRGMSLREAAKGLEKSHEWLNKIEKGDIKMDSETLIKLANLYKLPTDYFFRKTVELKVGKLNWHKVKY